MKRILTLVAISFFLCSTANAFQGGGGESTKKGASTKTADTKKKSKSSTKNASKPKPSSANSSQPKILWANDCDPRTSANYCQISNSLAILNEFYDAVNSVNGTITYHVPSSKQELAPYTVVILDFCFGAANDNSIDVIKQYIQKGGSAFIMGGNFCVPDPANNHSTAWYATQLTKDFGVTFTFDDDNKTQWADSIDVHHTTLDVNRLYFFRHAYLSVASPSKSIIRINGRPIAAIYDGTGTFVALSDEGFEWGGGSHSEEIASSDNFVFWRNSLQWLISQSDTKRSKLKRIAGNPDFQVPEATSITSPATHKIQTRTSQTGIEFVLIPAGSFMMGSNNGGADEKPMHQVSISQPFYMGKYEVTQAQWQAVMGNNPSNFTECGGNCPVESVSWYDVQSFISKLNERRDGFKYRLPTEAEWEYACRAGSRGDYAGLLDDMGWYADNSGTRTHRVGQKQANAFGLFDMHGNVSEWCRDWYDAKTYESSPATDPQGPGNGKYRVERGGCWAAGAVGPRSAARVMDLPDDRDGNGAVGAVGFRVVAVR